jgi:hypothetical protein
MTMTLSLHQQRTHPIFVPGCFGCKAGTLTMGPVDRSAAYQFAASITPQDDMDAYARLRRHGLQPPTINGSARLERHADHPYEIARGKLMRGKKQQQLKEAMTMLDDVGLEPMKPLDTPLPEGWENG